MKVIRSIAFIAMATMSAHVFANDNDLIGTWILEKSDNPMPNGRVVSYCTGFHGMIIYTAEGYVSVAINCAKEGVGVEPADISGRRFFYSGKYSYDGTTVTHTMMNASQAELIGSSFSRSVQIKTGTLILSGNNQGQQFSAHWKKVEK